METIHKRKSETGTGSHGPQELSNLHEDEGTKWTTSTMDARIKSIQLQNWIPTSEKRGESRTPSCEAWDIYLQQATRDKHEIWESGCQKSNTVISQTLWKPNLEHWQQPSSKTKMRGIYRRPAKTTMKSRKLKETWTKERKRWVE